MRLLLNVRFHPLPVDRPVYEFSLKTVHGAMLFGTNTLELGAADAAQTRDSDALVCFDFDPFFSTRVNTRFRSMYPGRRPRRSGYTRSPL